jgi:tRNA (cmo5U34)-methyltransferase
MTDSGKTYDRQAHDYDSFIEKLVPDYRLFNALVPQLIGTPDTILDLGCGTGTTALALLSQHPAAQLTCVDPSEQMLEAAKQKLPAGTRTAHGTLDAVADDARFNAVTSVMVMHNLPTLKARLNTYRGIHDRLTKGGVYISVDILEAETADLQLYYLEQWRSFMLQGLPADEVDTKWLPLHQEKDYPIKVSQQLSLLKEARFHTVDIVHKRFNFALMIAFA